MKKICIVITSLANGGTERFGATLSLMLSSLGYDLHIVTTKNHIDYKFGGTLFNLEEEANLKPTVFNKLRLLNDYFKKQQFDIIIDSRARRSFIKEMIIYKCFYRSSKTISMVHSHDLTNYFPVNKLFSKLLYSRCSKFVAVSKSIKKGIINNYGFKNIKQIYNPLNLKALSSLANEQIESLPYNYIIFFGRLDERSKNFKLLIDSYNAAHLKQKNIKLVIMGKDGDYNYIKDLINTHNINNDVILMDYSTNPFPYVKEALFTVLSSRYEGFPMSIIESLAVGTPVVSVDCESGPNEIIKNEVNGLLIKNNNSALLADAFNTMITDSSLYENCKSNALDSVAHLDVNKIIKQWQILIENE